MTGLWGELLYFVIFLILPFTPLGATDLFAPLSMFFIFIHLVVQHRTVLGLAYFLGSHLPNLWSANLSFSELIINLLIIDPIVVLVAFAFRYIHDQSQINARKAQESKELEQQARADAQQALQQAEEAAQTTRNKLQADLALYLHDTIAKDLARIALTAETIQSNHDNAVSPALAQQLRELSSMAHQASARVRPKIVEMNAEAHSNSINKTISDIEHMLSMREITLDTDISTPYSLDEHLSRQARTTAALILREGASNALKYSPEGSKIQLFLEVQGDSDGDGDTASNAYSEDSLTITMINAIASAPISVGLTSGFGLGNLHERVEAEGGEFSTIKTESTWILQARLVNVKEIQHEQLLP